MATKKEQDLKEFAKKMLVGMKKDQECETKQKDIQSRIDECVKEVQACDKVVGVYSTTQMAKELGMSSARKLYDELSDAGIVFRQGKEWMLTNRYSTWQLTEVATSIFDGKYARRLLWTERGRLWLLALKEKNVICCVPKPKTKKATPAESLVKAADTLNDEVTCLMTLLADVGNSPVTLLGDIITISSTINKHVSSLAFEACKKLNATAVSKPI